MERAGGFAVVLKTAVKVVLFVAKPFRGSCAGCSSGDRAGFQRPGPAGSASVVRGAAEGRVTEQQVLLLGCPLQNQRDLLQVCVFMTAKQS